MWEVRVRHVAFVAALLCTSALALNPNHRLTQYVHRVWQSQPGLPQASIYTVTQTHDGYLWLGTQSGVVRFDGVRFTSVRALDQAGLGSTWFRRIVEDNTGRVWLLADDGRLVSVNQQTAKVYDEVPYACLFAGQHGEVWACTTAGLVKFQGEQRESYPSSAPLASSLQAGCQDSKDGTIWLVGGSSVVAWNGNEYSRPALRSISNDALVRTVMCTADAVWFGTSKGLLQLSNPGSKNAHEALYTVKDGLPDNIVLSLAQAPGHIWVGTRNGLARIASGVIDSFGYRDGLSQQTALSITEDREGSLWVGTGNGLDQFLDGLATRYTVNEGLPDDTVGPVFEDHAGRLWTASPDGGLAVFNGQRFSVLPNTKTLQIQELAEDREGMLWAGTDSGLYRLNNGHVQEIYKQTQGLPSNKILSLFTDASGHVWAGTDRGPAVFRDHLFVAQQDLHAPIGSITQSKNGDMLFAVDRGGVYVFDGAKITPLVAEQALSQDPPLSEVTALYTDPSGVTWIGTNGVGLGMLRNGKFSRFFLRDGLIDPEIYGFMTDASDRLWMVGSKGFFWTKRSDFFDLAAGKIKRIAPLPYRPLDGTRTLQGTVGVSPVAALTRDGKLWFTATRALLAFDPDASSRGTTPPAVIEDISVNGASSSPERIRVLGPGRENVAIEYTALTFQAPQRLTFRYLLEGYDKDWTDAGSRREAFYTNLPPGKFKFRVAACVANGPCSESKAGLNFEVIPQFYQRAWFWPMLTLLCCLLGWLGYRFRMRQVHSKFALVLGERSRIARELHDTLIQGFSGITMQLQAMKTRLRAPEEKQVLEEIIDEAGICLQQTRRSVAGLRGATGEGGGLAAAISEAARHATDQHDVRLKLQLNSGDQTPLPAEVKYNLVCIAQEAVNNAVKHASARTIEVELAATGRQLRLLVRDDGVGLPSSPAGPGHYGMIGMRERAHQIGAELDISSFAGAGTSVSVLLPLSKPQTAVTPTPTTIESMP